MDDLRFCVATRSSRCQPLRGAAEAFASRLFGSHVTKTNALELLVIASFARDRSVRSTRHNPLNAECPGS